jgi:hypothetical protein
MKVGQAPGSIGARLEIALSVAPSGCIGWTFRKGSAVTEKLTLSNVPTGQKRIKAEGLYKRKAEEREFFVLLGFVH